jgi:hypothetical protein
MSLNNVENYGFNSLANLSVVNADEVNTTIFTKNETDPIISNTQWNQMYGLDTDQTIQEQIDELQTQISNSGTAIWGSFWSTQTQTNAGATATNLFTFNNADPSNNGVSLDGTYPSRLRILKDDVYDLQFSAQIEKTDSGTDSVEIWLRKNGVNVPDTNTILSLDGNNAKAVPAWNFVFTSVSGDYVELAWHSPDTAVRALYQAAGTNPTRPAIPSIICTVTNVTNRGGKGDTGATGAQGPQGERGPRGFKGEPGSGTVDDVARGLAGAALAEATLALAGTTALGLTVGGLSTTVAAQGASITTLQVKTQSIAYVTGPVNFGVVPSYEIDIPLYFPRVGTAFSPPAIAFNNNSASFFNYGITSADTISTTNNFESTAGTSRFYDVSISNALTVAGNTDICGGLAIGRNQQLQKKIIMYDGNDPGNDYDFTGIFTSNLGTSTFFNHSIDGIIGSAFRWFVGNGAGNSRILLKYMSKTIEASYTEAVSFLIQAGFSQKIQMVRDMSSGIVRMDLVGDTAGLGAYDGQIIQEKGNGLTENTGIMTVRSGTLVLGALRDTGLVDISSANTIRAVATNNVAIQSVAGNINLTTSANQDVNISTDQLRLTTSNNQGLVLEDVLNTQFVLTAPQNLRIQTSGGPGFDINFGSTGAQIFTASELTSNSFEFSSLSSGLDMRLNHTGSKGFFEIQSADPLKITTSNAAHDISINAARNVGLSTTAGNVNIQPTGNVNVQPTSSIYLQPTQNIQLTTTGGGITLSSSSADISFVTTSTANINVKSARQLNLSTTLGNVNIQPSGSVNMYPTSDVNMEPTGNVNLAPVSGSSINLTTTGVGGTMNINCERALTMNSTFGNINIKTVTGGDIIVQPANNRLLYLKTTGLGDIDISSGQNIFVRAGDTMFLKAPTAINFQNQFYFNRSPVSSEYTTSTDAIGYTPGLTTAINTGTTYSGTASDNGTPAQVGTFTLPARGVWFIQFHCLLTLNTGADTITDKGITLSDTTASNTPCAPGFRMTDPIDDAAGGSGGRQTYSFSGIYHYTDFTTGPKYINVYAVTSGSRTVTASGSYKYTRIA